jgi:hypothetical protein
MDDQRVKQQCKEEYSPPAVGEKEGGKKEGKKKRAKNCKITKWGPHWSSGPFTTLWI